MANLTEFKGEQTEKPKGFPALLEAYKPQIAAALPKHLNADRMARIALTCYRMTPKLADCDVTSLFAAVIQAAQLGLEPGLNGRAYIIPYGNQATFVPGWKGLVELANRSGRASAWTAAVYEGDEFDWQLGSDPYVKHKPMGEDDPEKITHVYAVGRVKGSDYPAIEVWTIGKVWKHRDRFNKVGKRHYSFEHHEMYARKVVLLQVLKYLPSTPELEAAIILNDHAEIGAQNLSIKDAIDGTFTPVAEESTGPAGSPASSSSPSSGSEQPGLAARSSEQQDAGGPYTSAHGDAFTMADDAIKSKDFKLARDILPKLHPRERKMVEERLPKEAK